MSNLGAIVKAFAEVKDRAADALDRGLRAVANAGRPKPRPILIPVRSHLHGSRVIIPKVARGIRVRLAVRDRPVRCVSGPGTAIREARSWTTIELYLILPRESL